MLPTLFNVVNNTEQVVEPESSLQSGVTMLNNIVDNIEQYGQHNIVQACFQQLVIFCRVDEKMLFVNMNFRVACISRTFSLYGG